MQVEKGSLLKSKIIDKNIRDSLNFGWINFAVLFCAIIIASVGLNMDSVTVIVGAMLVSPIMDPIIGMGYGFGIRDQKLIKKGFAIFLVEALIGLVAATLYFYLSPIKDAGDQLMSRTQPAIRPAVLIKLTSKGKDDQKTIKKQTQKMADKLDIKASVYFTDD